MRLHTNLSWSFVILVCLYLTKTSANEHSTDETKKFGKAFSIFSVVQFKNTECRSNSAMTSGQSPARNGTCLTTSECSSKGGTASGNCASGFGVCCIFLVSATGGTINQNCTYLRNPNFPTAYTASSALSYTVQKVASDICFFRLDFETFTTQGPADSTENPNTCRDTFKVTTTSGITPPTICGVNTGQHMYIDAGNQASDTATLAFTFGATVNAARNWEIKVSQIACSNPNRPPAGCLQYHTTPVGRISTFNYLAAASTHLANQEYSICVRRNAGFCCVEYQACDSQGFSIDVSNGPGFDGACSRDFITIPGSSNQCSTSSSNPLNNRYCGFFLLGLTANQPVCDCTEPFNVFIRTDGISDTVAAGVPVANVVQSKGVCLDYKQIPCGTV